MCSIKKRGRPPIDNPKDKRKVLKGVSLRINAQIVGTFDGKLNPENNTLKIYNYRGDITKFSEAIQEYAYDNNISRVIVKFDF